MSTVYVCARALSSLMSAGIDVHHEIMIDAKLHVLTRPEPDGSRPGDLTKPVYVSCFDLSVFDRAPIDTRNAAWAYVGASRSVYPIRYDTIRYIGIHQLESTPTCTRSARR